MSICVYRRIKRKCIDENLLERILVEFFSLKSDIIRFYIHLKGKVDSDILATSDVHDDICLLKGSEVIRSKNISYLLSITKQNLCDRG